MLLIWRRISSMHPGKFREEITHLGCIAVNTFSQAFTPTERKAKTSWLWGINQIRNREGKPTKYPQGVWLKNCDASEHLTWYSPTENEREAKAQTFNCFLKCCFKPLSQFGRFCKFRPDAIKTNKNCQYQSCWKSDILNVLFLLFIPAATLSQPNMSKSKTSNGQYLWKRSLRKQNPKSHGCKKLKVLQIIPTWLGHSITVEDSGCKKLSELTCVHRRS